MNICHRASLLYAFACLLLERMTALSQLPDWLELSALGGLLSYFAFAVFGYALHGWLKDTDNQLRRPHVLARWTLPPALVTGSMISLVLAEIGGFVILAYGAVQVLLAT